MPAGIDGPLLAALILSGGAALVAALRLFAPDQPPGADQPIDWPLAVFVAAVSVVIIAGWISVILAAFNVFSAWAIVIALSGTAALIFWKKRLVRFRSFSAPTRFELALGVLLLGSAVVYFRPHEYVLGGSDAGTYMNIAATAARTGEFVVQDDWSALLATAPEVTLRQQPAHYLTRYLQFVGYYLDDADPARVIPQFFPFHPLLLALGVSAGGQWGGLLVTPLWGVLSLAAVYFVTRKLFGAPLALLAATLLAVTPTHIYFARYPTTEPLTLLLIFSALLAFQTLWDDRAAGVWWGVFGGGALGAALLTRIDLPVVLIAFGAALLVVKLRGHWSRGWTWFALTLAIFVAHMVLDVLLINWPYFWNSYTVLRGLGNSPALIGAGVIGLSGAIGLGVIGWRRRERLPIRSVIAFTSAPPVRWGLAAGVIALSAYAYFVRPTLEPVRMATSWPGNVQYPILDGQNWVRIGWYITPLGIALATLGLAHMVRRESWLRLGLFLAVGVLTLVQYVYNIFNTPYHIYAMRRYVPIALPVLMIYAAYAVGQGWAWRKHWLNRGAALMLAAALLAGMIYQARFVLPQRDFFGASQLVARLEAQLKPAAIVVFSEPATASIADAFGVPLRFTYGHEVATLRGGDEAAVAQLLDRVRAYARAAQRPIQLLALDPISATVRNQLYLQPAGTYSMTLSALRSTFYEYPSEQQPAFYGFEIYDVLDQPPPVPDTLDIDVGTQDAAYIRSGVYGKDILPDGSSARWTAATAIIDVPLSSTAPITLSVRALTFRPESVPAADVTVLLDGQEIGRFRPGVGVWQVFEFAAQPQPVQGRSELVLSTSSFNLAQLGLSPDDRDLGFMLDRIQITR